MDNTVAGLITVSIVTIILSSLSMIVCNYYLWQKAKKLKLLSRLLVKVERHNQLIDNFSFLANLSRLSNTSPNNSVSVIEFQTALNLTRNSLLKSIELESFIYRDRQNKTNYSQSTHRDLMSGTLGSYERLLANLEDDLVTWSSWETNCSQQDRHLLAEAIDLGLSVHREVQKVRALRELD